ncbi:50S ribosomal protein L30e [Staphylothermus hellenicus]|uniref:Large ribosomal subunit protein eL30 n=1 Tax=Staphylothermus hellenicus (strain DSM 12710 / JCM 10830 / BK20S6-10-b1 / P8) TaxID=591019 RepID=D7DAF1_STAHD|nr:50S ribosomal protein L30e [Staphylothermus hellenicus]ADI32747.1 ribosomal protein L7Ae/L30e/S12e/Gadd45 [Staphylothermus hellenicus DSM 12710]
MSSSSIDFIRALQMAIKTGEVILGSKRTIKLVLHGKAKLVVIAANAPPEIKRDIEYYAKLSKIPIYKFPGTNIELGTLAGKPFGVSAMAIVDPGQSNILEIVEEESE